MKQANPYVEHVVSDVKRHGKAAYAAESLYWQCKPLFWFCKLWRGRPEQRVRDWAEVKPKKAALSSEWSYTRGSERGETGGLSACRGLCYAAAANWSATVIDVWERSVLSIWRLMQCASDNFIVRKRIVSSFSCKPIFCTAVALLKIATCLAWKIFPVQLFAWVLLTATPTVLHSL